jgi:hypothetical protein
MSEAVGVRSSGSFVPIGAVRRRGGPLPRSGCCAGATGLHISFAFAAIPSSACEREIAAHFGFR